MFSILLLSITSIFCSKLNFVLAQSAFDQINFPNDYDFQYDYDDLLNSSPRQFQQQNSRLPLLPQLNRNNEQVNINPNRQTVITEVPPATTKSPAFIRCLSNCPTTSEYNPVCGSDNLLYNNRQKLDCTNFCGPRIVPNWMPVTQLRAGSCQPFLDV